MILLSTLGVGNANVFIDCNYEFFKLKTLSETYACEPKVLKTGDTRNVIGVTNNHKPNRGNDDVNYFRMSDQPIGFIPSGIETYFQNLVGLRFHGCEIKEISKEDLQPFPELKLLSLSSNLLTLLKSDLFAYTPDLKWIFLESNFIVHVGPALLNSLKYLEIANFSSNICIDENAQNSYDLLRMKLKFETNCSPMMMRVIAVLEKQTSPLLERLNNLENKVKFLERQINNPEQYQYIE